MVSLVPIVISEEEATAVIAYLHTLLGELWHSCWAQASFRACDRLQERLDLLYGYEH